MWFGVISLFPDMFAAIRDVGMTGRAINQGLIQLETWNPRDFTTDNYRRVDERHTVVGRAWSCSLSH